MVIALVSNIMIVFAAQSWNSSKELQDGDLENEVHAWRQPLKAWLSICYQNETFYRVIDFLLVTVSFHFICFSLLPFVLLNISVNLKKKMKLIEH